MAWDIVGVTSGNTTADTTVGTFSIGSQTYLAGKEYFIGFLWANLVNAQASPLVSIAGTGVVGSLVLGANYGASNSRRRTEVWTFSPVADTTTTLLVTFAVGENSTAHCWSIVRTNASQAGTLPQTPQMNRSTGAAAITATLSTFADSGNAALGFFGAVGTNGAMSIGSGFTQIHSEVVAAGTTICLFSEYKTSQDATIDANAGGVNDIIGIGLELKSAELSLSSDGLASSSGSAALGVSTPLASSGLASSAGAADLRTTLSLIGTGVASSSGSAEGQITVGMEGAGLASSSGSADLTLTQSFSADALASSSGTASVGLGADLSGTGEVSSSGSADLTLTVSVEATGLVSTSGSANVVSVLALGGIGMVSVDGSAVLFLPLPYHRPPFSASGSSGRSGTSGTTGRTQVVGNDGRTDA